MIYIYSEPSFAFLHFFAIASQLRTPGLGGHLLEMIVKDAEQQRQALNNYSQGSIWKIEYPHAAADKAEQGMRLRRIHFYLTQGAQFFQYHFIQLPIDGLIWLKCG